MRKLSWMSGLALALGLSACVAATDSMTNVADGTRAEPLEAQSAASGFVDQDGDGVCDRMQSGQPCGCMGKGPGFVDQDGDGVCDHRQQAGAGRGHGPGQGRGHGSGRGRGPGFVDQNGDGICDRMQAQSP
jgi:hypothetical protein